MEVLSYKKFKKQKKAKSEAEQKAMETQERNRYYQNEQAKNEGSAKKYERYVLSIPEFKNVHVEIGKLDIAIAKAEVFNSVEAPSLIEHRAQLYRQKTAIMKKYKIDPKLLSSLAYVNCKECNDTGQRSDKSPCMCWKVIRW